MSFEEAEQKGRRPRARLVELRTMSGGKCYPSVAKTRKVQCRVETCKQEVASQNYERHLRRFHPSENPKNLRAYGQREYMFGIAKALAPSNEDASEDKESCVGEDQVAVKGNEGDVNENFIDTLNEAPAGGGGEDDDILVDSSRSSEKSGSGMKRPRLEPEEAASDDLFDVADYLAGIEETIDSILLLVPLNISVNYHKKRKDRIKSKLDHIKGNLKVSAAVSELDECVKEIKKLTCNIEKVDTSKDSIEEVKRVLAACRSVSEIEVKVPEFRYDDEAEKVKCIVCKTEFKYDISLEEGRKQSDSLGNLKSHLKKHLAHSETHQSALAKSEAKEKIDRKEESRNEKCGMNLARTAYYLLSNGRPSCDFTQLLSMLHKNGCDIGDINHSTDFVTNLAQCLSTVIERREKSYLSTRLPQTGCLPPCKVVEDGATYRHDTRHLIGITTIFPGNKPLIQSVFCGAPKGVGSDGISTAKSMAATVSPFIIPEQYLGTSQDGANYLAHVGEHLDKEMGKEGEGYHDWDGVHAAATVDTGMRNPKKPWAKQFSWLNSITEVISKANKFHNWGMEWDRFFRVSFVHFIIVLFKIGNFIDMPSFSGRGL